MFSGDMEIPEQLKDIVKHSSEAELTDIVLQSLREAIKDPDAFAKMAGNNIPPMLISSLKKMPMGDQMLRPMAQSMAKMLIKQVKHGQKADFSDFQESLQSTLFDPSNLPFMNDLMSDYEGDAKIDQAGQIPPEVNRLVEQSLECKKQDDYEQAESLLQQALDICQRDLPESKTTCQVLNYLATTQLILEKYLDAETNLKNFLTLAEKQLPPNDHLVASSYFGLAMVRESQGKTSDADLLYNKAISIAEKSYADNPMELAYMLETLGNFYEGQKLYRKSDPLFQRALTLREKELGSDNLEVAEQFVRYALVLEARKNFTDAEMWCYRSLTIKHALLKPSDPDLARNQALLASIYIGQEQCTKAEPIITQSIATLEEAGDEDDLIYPLEIYARLLKATDREDEAKKIEERLLAYEQS